MKRSHLGAAALTAMLACLAAMGCDAEQAERPAPAASSPAAPAATPSASQAPLVAPLAASSAAVEDAGTAPLVDAAAPRASAAPATKDAGAKPPKEKDAGSLAADAGAPAVVADGGAAAQAAPAPGSAEAVAADVDQIYAGKKTFSARFKQEHTQKVSGVVKTSSGTLFVEKPNKISFRYDPPSKNRIVSDGRTLTVYIAEDNQALVQPAEKTEYPGALSFIMGHGLRESFTFTFNDKATFTGGPVLVGTPKVPTPSYNSVLFYVDDALRLKRDPGTVRRVLIVDAQGNRNRFDFEGARQPDAIDPGEFAFTLPPGVNVNQGH